jgi:alpha-ketoglutaric semialdehyde dehydrogenase
MASVPRLRHFVGGNWRESAGGEYVPDRNPSDAKDIVGLVPSGDSRDVEAAVRGAADSLPGWKGATGPARAEHLYRWSAAIAERNEELAQAMAREVGKPITEARGEVARCVAILRYYAGEAVREIGQVIPSQFPATLQFTLRQPLGVVALITPWNFPLAIPLWKAAPALAFGNTVVLKPAEAASHMATLLAETAAGAGLPPGVFNVLLGSGSVIGDPLLRHEAVAAVSFTGSSTVGGRVAATAAARNIRYQTEMGGKNVAIVLPDADLDLAATLVAGGAMRFAGQKCTATSRAVVDARVEVAFLEKLRAQVEALPLGPVTDPSAAVGPMVSDDARQSVLKALGASKARRVFGGAAPADPPFSQGYFLTPAVVAQVEPDSDLAQEELFAPVLAVLTAKDLDEAITLANRTRYGLSASLFTRDLKSALTYIHRIEAGLVRVNGDTTGVDPHAPFGGVKGSSSGTREQGPAAREFYTEIKTIQVSGG